MRLRVFILVAAVLVPSVAPALCAAWCAPRPQAGTSCCEAEGAGHGACGLTGEPAGGPQSCCAICPVDDGPIPPPQPPTQPARLDLHIPVAVIVPWTADAAEAPARLARLALRGPRPWSLGACSSVNAVLCIWRN